ALNEQSDPTKPRDIALLTHPRTLRESDLTASFAGTRPTVRLFAVAADDSGAVSLARLRDGGAVVLSRAHLDLSATDPAVESTRATPVAPNRNSSISPQWSGDIERLPFPFVLGTVGAVRRGCLDFDLSGRYLMVASDSGLLLLWDAENRSAAMVP